MSPEGFKVNPQGVREVVRALEREFAKHRVAVPVEAVLGDHTDFHGENLGTTVNYHGPVVQVTGDHAQLAWDNQTVTQNQSRVEEIAGGYEELATVLVTARKGAEQIGMSEAEVAEVQRCTDEVLGEITKPKPDRTLVERGTNAVKGLLAAAAVGVGAEVTAESQDFARTVIEQLGQALS